MSLIKCSECNEGIPKKNFFNKPYIGNLLTFVMVLSSIVFFTIQNNRDKEQFYLTIRPYLIMGGINAVKNSENQLTNYTFDIKNIGNSLAQLQRTSFRCYDDNNPKDVKKNEYDRNMAIGKDQSISEKLELNVLQATCTLTVYYNFALNDLSNKDGFITEYQIKHSFNGPLVMTTLLMK